MNKGAILVIAAAVLWGTTGTAQALAPVGAHPIVVGTMRLMIGGLTILLFARVQGGLSLDRPLPIPAILIGGLTDATYQLCFFAAVRRTGVVVGTIVAIGSSPVMAGLLDIFVERRPPRGIWYIATAMAVTGCMFLTAASSTSLTVDDIGVLLALGAGLSYAIYAICSKRLLRRYPPDTVMSVIFCLGALILSPILIWGRTTWLFEPAGFLAALHLGVIATGFSYILYARGLKLISVSRAVSLSLAEPLTAGLLGLLVLGEQLTPMTILGILLLLGGLLAITKKTKSD